MEYNEDDLVLCTVERIQGTTVFVKIEDDREGTLTTSEISPGRIRNLRDYVVPGKKIVCKVLKVAGDNIHLSLRRVTDKEKREVLEQHSKERSAASIIKSVASEKHKEIIKKIKEKSKSIYEFLQSCKEKPQELSNYFSSEEVEKICKILQERKEKEVEVKKEFTLKSDEENGLEVIKKILKDYNGIKYLGSGRYTLLVKSKEYKTANQKMQRILSEIEGKADSEKADFDCKEK